MNAGTNISGPGLDAHELRISHDAPVRSLAPEARNLEDATKPITAQALADLLAGGGMRGARGVGPRNAMKASAVFACVRTIANSIARMPLILYERTETGRERAKDHPLYRVLKDRPNPRMSSFSLRSTLMANTLLWGNGYAEIIRRGDGMPVAIVPIESDRVSPFIEGGELRYEVAMPAGDRVRLLARDVIHVPGLSYDGISGLSVISHARMTVAGALESDEFLATFLANGLKPSGVLQHPGKLGDAAVRRLRESFQAVYGGAANSGKPMILEEGMSWHTASMPLEDAQFIEGNYFRTEEIARWFNVPPHKIQHLARSTNNNIEQQSLDFLSDTLSPWVEAMEQELNYKLFGLAEDRFYCEHLTNAIIQMDANARGQLYERLSKVAGITPDEIRERENMNYLPEGRGRYPWIQSSNMPLPTEAQRDQLVESWIKKGAASPPGGAGGPGDGAGKPDPKTDDQVANS
jgi:HK97 family phage portal protein